MFTLSSNTAIGYSSSNGIILYPTLLKHKNDKDEVHPGSHG